MEHEFWHDKWRTNQIPFHEADVHPLLTRYWPALGVAGSGRVFVPLCGKSNDMRWLREQGHEIIGVELSEIGVRAFFGDNGLAAEVDAAGAFKRYRAPGFELLCGDFFVLSPRMLGPFAAVYDRAALIALPLNLRRQYAERLRMLCRPGAAMLLITLQYAPGAIEGPPFLVTDDEIGTLFGSWCTLTRLGSGDATVKGVTCRETAHRIVVAGAA